MVTGIQPFFHRDRFGTFWTGPKLSLKVGLKLPAGVKPVEEASAFGPVLPNNPDVQHRIAPPLW